MISEYLLDLLFRWGLWLIDFLPDVSTLEEFAPSAFSSMNDAIEVVAEKLGILNVIFPMDTLMVIVGITLLFNTMLGIFAFINWLFNKIRGAG